MTTTVDRRASKDESPPYEYQATMTAAGDSVVIEPDRSRSGGLGVSNFVWWVEKNGSPTFTLEIRIAGEWETDDRIAPADIAGKVHHHDTPLGALRITQSAKGSDDAVVRIASEWLLQVG